MQSLPCGAMWLFFFLSGLEKKREDITRARGWRSNEGFSTVACFFKSNVPTNIQNIRLSTFFVHQYRQLYTQNFFVLNVSNIFSLPGSIFPWIKGSLETRSPASLYNDVKLFPFLEAFYARTKFSRPQSHFQKEYPSPPNCSNTRVMGSTFNHRRIP